MENKKVELKTEERQKCEVWSRVMGYHRPIAGWNIGKKQEFQDRKYFKEPVVEQAS
jgi:anaerobic ribonucleoside-triphosphate reductase